MHKNILVTGTKGQLGSDIQCVIMNENTNKHQYFFTDKTTLDITNKEAIEQFCILNDIQIIINCAAYTAVDKAEEDAKNANNINHTAVRYLAEVSKKNDISLIHISTDYVFDGIHSQPYREDDESHPQGVYGETKLAGENAMIEVSPMNSIIIRTSWVYSTFGNNFVKTMLRIGKDRDELGVIFDQIGTPTYAKDLAKSIIYIINNALLMNKSVEVYHYSNEGVASWFDFAKEIFSQSNISCNVRPITTKEYPTPAKRPFYSVQNKRKFKDTFGMEIPYWKDSLKECLETLNKV